MTRRVLRAFFCVLAALGFGVSLFCLSGTATPTVLFVSALVALVGVIGAAVYGGPGYGR